MEALDDLVQVLHEIDALTVGRLAIAILDCAKRKGAVYVFGNGGSAAIAEHFALDLERMAGDKSDSRSIRATCLAISAPRLTADGNDFGFDKVFAKPLERYVAPGDIVIAISASGESADVVNALNIARAHHALCIGMTRAGENPTSQLCDIALEVPATSPALIETAFSCICFLVTCRIRAMAANKEKPQ
jgi:D-sedoheptulose 7-phosphate isomerase